MECVSVQHLLHGVTLDDMAAAHVEACAGCTIERRVALATRASLVLEAPPELSARLLSLPAAAQRPTRVDMALQQALVLPAPPDLSKRLEKLALQGAPAPAHIRRPWVMTVYVLTALLLGVSLAVAGQVYGLALQELATMEWWRTLAALPSQLLEQVYAYFPQGRYITSVFLSLQRALQWLLVGLLMWAVLEMRLPQRTPARA